MHLEIEVDGEVIATDVHVDAQRLMLSQAERLEEKLGIAEFNRLMSGEAGGMRMVRMVIWTQLVDHISGLEPDGFDLDLSALADINNDGAGGEVVELPMTLPDGSEMEGSSVDPTKAATGSG